MSVLLALTSCLAVLVALGLLERRARDRAFRTLPIRIHVNGTRGKSTVTRLIHAALGEAGVAVVGKVTGTAPRLLLPDGSERPVRRRAPAAIGEQLWLMRTAARLGARAVVAECMAVRPDLQWTSERDMVRATIGVVTNVRTDHTEVMGRSLEEIARSLANTTPPGGALILGCDADEAGSHAGIEEAFAERAAKLGARLVRVRPASAECGDGRSADWLEADRRLALAVTRELGIADAVAQAGMDRATADPGAARTGVIVLAGAPVAWLDATAANDPESLDELAAWSQRQEPPPGPAASGAPRDPSRAVLVYNHRDDRPERLRRFIAGSATLAGAGTLIVTGDRPAWTTWRLLRQRRNGSVRFVPGRRLPTALSALAGAGTRFMLFSGNTRGFDRESLLRALAGTGDA